MAVLCNINFSRALLIEAKKRQVPIATDVHVVDDVNDDYNKDFMKYADILFLSNEKITGREKEFVSKLAKTYNNEIIVVGMGDKSALIYVREYEEMKMFSAVHARKVVSTIGAGDSLFSAFIYFYCKNHDPYDALKNATVFASYKIGGKRRGERFFKRN